MTVLVQVHPLTFDLYKLQTPHLSDSRKGENTLHTSGIQKSIVSKIPAEKGGLLLAQSILAVTRVNWKSFSEKM